MAVQSLPGVSLSNMSVKKQNSLEAKGANCEHSVFSNDKNKNNEYSQIDIIRMIDSDPDEAFNLIKNMNNDEFKKFVDMSPDEIELLSDNIGNSWFGIKNRDKVRGLIMIRIHAIANNKNLNPEDTSDNRCKFRGEDNEEIFINNFKNDLEHIRTGTRPTIKLKSNDTKPALSADAPSQPLGAKVPFGKSPLQTPGDKVPFGKSILDTSSTSNNENVTLIHLIDDNPDEAMEKISKMSDEKFKSFCLQIDENLLVELKESLEDGFMWAHNRDNVRGELLSRMYKIYAKTESHSVDKEQFGKRFRDNFEEKFRLLQGGIKSGSKMITEKGKQVPGTYELSYYLDKNLNEVPKSLVETDRYGNRDVTTYNPDGKIKGVKTFYSKPDERIK